MPDLILDDLFRCGSDGSVVFALDGRGVLVHVDDVPKGKACGCRCVGCGRPLIARQGSLAHSFAHEANAADPPCNASGETALHLIAKDHLAAALALSLPSRELKEDGFSEQVVNAGRYEFDRAEVERALPGMRPDVIVHKGGRALLVEFEVTHACDEEKIARIREQDIAAIEINLGPYRSRKLDDLRDVILHEAPRKWLHNPRDRAAKERLDVKRRMRDEKVRKDAERRVGAYRVVKRGNGSSTGPAAEHGLVEAVGIDVPGAGGFSGPADEWQTRVLLELLGAEHWLKPEYIVKQLERRRMVRSEFASIPPDVRAVMRKSVALPDDAVDAFLIMAAKGGWVAKVQNGWCRTGRLIEVVERANALRERPGIRREVMEEAVAAVLAVVPEGDRIAFDLEAWWQCPNPGLGGTPAAALHFEEPEWDAALSSLAKLKNALSFNPERLQDALGLPIIQERDRRIERRRRDVEERKQREQDRLEKEADGRVVAITKRAREVLGSDADQWLSKPTPDLQGVTPERAARASAEMARKANGILAVEEEGRRGAAIAAQTKLNAVWELEKLALRAFGDDLLKDLWMRSGQPKLERRSPRDYCVDRATMEECARLLPKKR